MRSSSEVSRSPVFLFRCAEAFARAGGKRKWEEIEAELLNGQKLQGPMTSAELMPVIKANKLEKKDTPCIIHFKFKKCDGKSCGRSHVQKVFDKFMQDERNKKFYDGFEDRSGSQQPSGGRGKGKGKGNKTGGKQDTSKQTNTATKSSKSSGRVSLSSFMNVRRTGAQRYTGVENFFSSLSSDDDEPEEAQSSGEGARARVSADMQDKSM